MGFFNKNKGVMIPPNATFRITQAGEEELQKFNMDDNQAILVALQTNGTCTVDEIARHSGLNKGTVEKRIPPLVGKTFIQYISRGSSSSGDEELG